MKAKGTITCDATGKTVKCNLCANGEPRLPRGWKRIQGRVLCPEGFSDHLAAEGYFSAFSNHAEANEWVNEMLASFGLRTDTESLPRGTWRRASMGLAHEIKVTPVEHASLERSRPVW